MENSIFTQAAKFLQERRNSRRWKAVVICLAVIVVGGTAWLLSQKGQALTHAGEVLDCQVKIHEHTETCYDENGNLICEKADYVFHTHNEHCYDADSELVCQLLEVEFHEHDKDCFEYERILTCGYEEAEPEPESEIEKEVKTTAEPVQTEAAQPETELVLTCGMEEHTHDDSCYEEAQKTLICGQEEGGHTHDDSCYEEESKRVLVCGQEEHSHTHDDSCYNEKRERVLTCEEEESDEEDGHTHDDSCYEEQVERELACGQEEGGHTHDDSCYEEQVERKLVCGEEEYSHTHDDTCYAQDGERILLCGKEEHQHSDACYEVNVLESSQAEPVQAAPGEEVNESKETQGHIHTDACYQVVQKHLICEKKGIHIHTEDCYDEDGILVCDAPYVEYVEEHVHDDACFKEDEDAEYTSVFSDDKIVVKAYYKKAAGIPKDAQLGVTYITEESNKQSYDKWLAALEDDTELAMLLQIGFYTEDERFLPEDTVRFAVSFLDDSIYAEGDKVTAAVFEEDTVIQIAGTDIDSEGTTTFETKELSELAFVLTTKETRMAQTLTYQGEDYIMTITLGADTQIPEDAGLTIDRLTPQNSPEHYAQRCAELEEEDLKMLLRLWVSVDGQDTGLKEKANVKVQFLNDTVYAEGDPVAVACIDGEEITRIAGTDIDSEGETSFTVEKLSELAFITAEEEHYVHSLTYTGMDYIVTVDLGEETEIPEEAQLMVEQIAKESEQYQQRLTQLAAADDIFEEEDDLALLLHIWIEADGEEIALEEKARVCVQFLNNAIYAEGNPVTAVCIDGEDITQISGTDIDSEGSTTFTVEKLSELAFITTEEDRYVSHLTYEGENYIVTVDLGEEEKIPKEAQLMAEQIAKESEQYQQRLAEAEGILEEEEGIALLLRMWIEMDDEEITLEETAKVTVQFLDHEIYTKGDAVKAAQFTKESVELLTVSVIDDENATAFETDNLMEYAFITGNVRTMICEGEDFVVTVQFKEDAQIPKDAELVAKRITAESDPEYFTAREDQLQDEIEDEIIALGALFDISFYDADGNEVEPKDVVDVKIQLLDKSAIEETDSAKVVHFVIDAENANESVEIIKDADVVKDEEGGLSTSFQTESFSLYAITVNGVVDSASTLRKAIKMAQDGRDEGSVKLEDDIVFTKLADAGDQNGAMPINAGKRVTLDLNGYTITVDPSTNVNGNPNVSLFDISGSLYITDSSSNKEVKETRIGVSNKDMNNPPQLNYDTNENHLNFITCYVTKSEVIDSLSGATREDVYEYTVSGHGAIIGSKKNESPLLWVTGQGRLDIDGGVIVGGNGNRAVEISGNGNSAVADLHNCYLIDNNPTSGNGGGAVYCGNGGTINVHDGAVISGNKGHQGGGIYVGASTINMDGGYITNNETTFGSDLSGNYGGGGGGILLRNASIVMQGGYITGNKVYTEGGGISIEGTATMPRKIEGGFISSNYCLGPRGDGAGIALCDQSSIEISATVNKKVYITNNEVFADGDWGGAGMFVGENSTANLFNTLITNNLAEGFGGGLSGCSTGRIYTNDALHGAAIFDNTALGSKQSGYISSKQEDKTYTENNPAFWEFDSDGRYYFQDCFTALYTELDNTMLGGGSENWDGSIDGERIDTTKGHWASTYIAGLTAYPSPESKSNAMTAASVYINGNHSVVHGGGIMCNGIMVIGEHPHEIEITSAMKLFGKKKLVDANGNELTGFFDVMVDGQFSFTIYSDEECKKPITTGTNNICDKEGIKGHEHDASCNYETISFVEFLKFDLKNDSPVETEEVKKTEGMEKKEEIGGKTVGTYKYYIKEDDAAQNPLNIEIVSDDTLYRLTVTVTKWPYGKVAGSNIDKYIDDITHVQLEKKDGNNWVTVYENYDNEHRLTNETHPVELTLKVNNDGPLFTNTKSGVTRIDVEKRWNYKEGYEPGGSEGSNKIKWVSVGLFKDGREITGLDPNYKEIILNKENGWKGSWENLSLGGRPEDYIVMEKYVGYYDPEDKDNPGDPNRDPEPADWLFVPTFEYSNEKEGVGKVTITNTPKTFGLEFIKKGYDGKFVYGAKFEIYMMDKDDNEPDINKRYSNPQVLWFSHVSDGYECINYNDIPDKNSARYTTTLSTNIEGKLRIANLWSGSFLIREVQAPVGYKPVHDHIVDYSGGTATQKMLCVLPNGEIKQNGVDGYMCSEFEKIPAEELSNTLADRGTDYFDYVNDVLMWRMIDPEDKYELPESGGPGTDCFNILGGAIVMFGITALTYMTYRRRRGDVSR